MAVNIGPQLSSMLSRYGLGGLATWVSQRITDGASPEEIELELYDRPEFKAAFPEIEARRQVGEERGVTLRPISPEEILEYRTQARSLMRSYGLHSDFYGQNSDFFDLIVYDVSLDELNWRLENARSRVVSAPPEVRSVFGELFGADSDNALFSIFVSLDRAVPALENMLQRAEAGGAARRFGFDLNEAEMIRLEQQNTTYDEAVQGFSLLDTQRMLFEETLAEEGEDYEVGEEGIEAVFGLEAGAAEKLRRRGETRAASTKGGGGIGLEERGATGFGAAGQR